LTNIGNYANIGGRDVTEKGTNLMTDEVEIQEYKIHEDNLPWLDKKFDKMRKVAEQVGSKPPVYKVLREEYIEGKKFDESIGQWVSDGFYKNFIITVDGEAPKLAGWSFVASVTHTKDGNLINKVPRVLDTIPERYRTGTPVCDYCQLSRKRIGSFIVRNDKTGEYQQIGRNCLAKFLGYSNPERVAQYATWLTNLADDIGDQEDKLFSGGSHRNHYRSLEEFLTMVVAVTEEKGWVSKAQAQGTDKSPSVNEVEYQLSPYSRKDKNWERNRITPTKEHRERALATIQFARSDALTTDTDYKHNLKISTASDMFHDKASGIVASLINFKDRTREQEILMEQRRQEREKQQSEMKKSEYVGVAGERIAIPVRVIRRRVLEGQFGTTYLFRMVAGDGDVLVWFASNDLMEDGKWYNLTGTIKKLETYEDVKQTVVTRCKVGEIEEIVADDLSEEWEKTKEQVLGRVQRGKRNKVKLSGRVRTEPMTMVGGVRR